MIDLNAPKLDAVIQLRGRDFENVRTREQPGKFTTVRQLDNTPGQAGKWDSAKAAVSAESVGPTVT